jgi:hypothetical protein
VNVVDVFDESCGFHTRITVCKENADMVNLTVASDCEAATRWGQTIKQVDWRQCLGKKFPQSLLWQSAMKILRHRSCPLPMTTLRAIEAEVGATRPADIRIHFLPSEEPDKRNAPKEVQ